MTATAKTQLVVFDFDWSMVDQDSDRWVFEVLAPDLRRRIRNLTSEMQWTDLIADSLQILHGRGGTRKDIEHTLRIIPFHPAMMRTIKKLKEDSSRKTTCIILSNANSVFIDTILEPLGLRHHFDEIVTNPAEWEPSGLLKLRRRVDPQGPQHQCRVGCSPNMCKGAELEAFIDAQSSPFDRVIYIGDGSNDFCPVIRLRSQDVTLCRNYRGLRKRIETEGATHDLKCDVEYWTGAWEVEEFFARDACL